jgi:hypothetical protein
MASGERFFYNTNTAYRQGDDIIDTGGVLNMVGGFNPTANAGFLMVFNAPFADVSPGDIPVLSFLVPAAGSFSFADVLGGLKFAGGLSFGVSTTGDVYTASADEWWLLAQGREL